MEFTPAERATLETALDLLVRMMDSDRDEVQRVIGNRIARELGEPAPYGCCSPIPVPVARRHRVTASDVETLALRLRERGFAAKPAIA